MKKSFCFFLLASLFLIGTAYAGPAKVMVFQEIAGVTVVCGASASSGTSRVAVIDLKEAKGPDQFFGLFSITYPHGGRAPDGDSGVSPITFGLLSGASGMVAGVTGQSTGITPLAGVTIPYYYIVTDTPKTAREIESIGKSGVTLIAALPVGSSSTPYQLQQFLPEPGRYLHILVGSSITDYNRPGVYVGLN